MSGFKRRMMRANGGVSWPTAKACDPPKINAYRCPDCGKDTVTRDIHEGTTPSMMMCMATPGCQGKAQSRWYRVPDGLVPIWEWFRPTYMLALRAEKKHPGMLNHARNGGLFARKIETPEEIQ